MMDLLSNMWVFLAGSAIVGSLIGWAIRGIFIPPARNVTVTPGLSAGAEAELSEEQAAALARGEEAERAAEELRNRLSMSEDRLSGLEQDLNKAKEALDRAEAEREEAKASGGGLAAAAAGVAGAVVGAAAANAMSGEAEAAPDIAGERDPAAVLTWRNRYLESRVRYLEGKVADAANVPAVDNGEGEKVAALTAQLATAQAGANEAEGLKAKIAELETQVQAAPAPTAAPEAPSEEESLKKAKLEWQNRYLKARVSYIEENAASIAPVAATAGVAAASVAAVNNLSSAEREELVALRAAQSEQSAGEGENEQELARLRWRNRYLEGRLNYLDAASIDAQNNVEQPAQAAPAAMDAAPVTTSTVSEPPADPYAGINEVQPPALTGARNGVSDDLKRIGGIGPKIEGILNELGVFHYDQIAAWSDAESAWIDNYLRFSGRIAREKWVDQAKSLVG